MPRLCLEIRRGLTQFPRRPIVDNRFLIGAGVGCDLRLCGSQIPPLHSLIHIEGDNVWLEAVVSHPPLLVNGEIKQTVTMEKGHLIEIGSFQLMACPAEPADAELAAHTGRFTKIVCDDPQNRPDSDHHHISEERTANELVALIEAEEKLVEDFDARRALGATALLHAALQSARFDGNDISLLAERFDEEDSFSHDFPAVIPFDQSANTKDIELVDQMEQIVQHLELFDAQLETRSKKGRDLQPGKIEASAEWRAVEHRLFQQLKAVLDRLNSPDENKNRAIA